MSALKDGHKSQEGAVSTQVTETVTEERIRLFRQAIGVEASSIAPPTFLTVFRAGEFELFDKMGLKLSNVLHGEQQYSYDSELQAGERIAYQTTLSSVLEKRGSSGRLSFLTFETSIRADGPDQRSIARSKTTVIVREKNA